LGSSTAARLRAAAGVAATFAARGPFEHSGSVATLEDWFDPRRLRDDYGPTGFKGFGVTTRAVKGHPYGLALSSDDRAALIAFLKTL
jgi:hypothetical protein